MNYNNKMITKEMLKGKIIVGNNKTEQEAIIDLFTKFGLKGWSKKNHTFREPRGYSFDLDTTEVIDYYQENYPHKEIINYLDLVGQKIYELW